MRAAAICDASPARLPDLRLRRNLTERVL